ncbi:MAG: LysR family transcriptional regulator [Lachnospiraceae bacterium]|nr:LysR family transcriptional regulator [Lachnospiraceae bacterium]
MTTDQIRIFLRIVETKSFSTAALDLFTTQSSVSKKIQQLEDELGVKLFERTARKAKLTHAGEEFASHAKIIFDVYQQMMTRMEHYSPQKKNVLRVSSEAILYACGLLHPLLNYFNSKQMTISIAERTTIQDILKDLSGHNADFVLIHDIYLDDNQFMFVPIQDERMACVFSRNSPLRKKKELRLSDLQSEVFLVNHSDYLQEQRLIDNCIRSGFMPQTLPMDIRLSTMMRHIQEGNCVAVLDIHTVEASITEGNDYRPVVDIPEFSLGFAYDPQHLAHHEHVVTAMNGFRSFFAS